MVYVSIERLKSDDDYIVKVREKLAEIAKAYGLDGPANAAISFVARHPANSVIVLGTGKRERIELDNPPKWMTPELVARYQQIYDLQRESGMSLAEMGVRYIAAQPDIDTIIIGAKAPAEIEECVQSAEKGPLPKDLIQKIEGELL